VFRKAEDEDREHHGVVGTEHAFEQHEQADGQQV
jgi:hypothetical protein